MKKILGEEFERKIQSRELKLYQRWWKLQRYFVRLLWKWWKCLLVEGMLMMMMMIVIVVMIKTLDAFCVWSAFIIIKLQSNACTGAEWWRELINHINKQSGGSASRSKRVSSVCENMLRKVLFTLRPDSCYLPTPNVCVFCNLGVTWKRLKLQLLPPYNVWPRGVELRSTFNWLPTLKCSLSLSTCHLISNELIMAIITVIVS